MQSSKERQQKSYASDYIVIDDDSDSEPCKTSPKTRKHGEKHHNKRKVKIDRLQSIETLVVTQEVKVKKQKFQCVINLTNICEHEQRPTKSDDCVKDRIVPKCLRKCYRNQLTKKNEKIESFKHEYKTSHDSKCDWASLSPISITSLDDNSKLSYEDIISSDGFCSDEDIDYLIKRTKDRERKLSKSFDSTFPLYASTPNQLEYETISDDAVMFRSSEIDTSLRSTTTLVLEPQLELYSPTNPTSPDMGGYTISEIHDNYSLSEEDVDNNNTVKKDGKYSPAIEHNVKSSLDTASVFQHSCLIKNEPYSPSKSPVCCMQEQYPYEVPIKFENTELYLNEYNKTENPNASSDVNVEKHSGAIDVKPGAYFSSRDTD